MSLLCDIITIFLLIQQLSFLIKTAVIFFQFFPPMFKYINVYNLSGTLVSVFALLITLFSWPSNNEFALNVAFCQTFYLLEIINIFLGVSKSRIFPTSLQLSSRLFITWFICYWYNFNDITVRVMLTCWFLADATRYSFYFSRRQLVKFLRYNLFIVLYPLGTFCELVLLCRAEKVSSVFLTYFLRCLMLCYVPGFVFLYFHMIRRRKWTRKNVVLKKKSD